MRISEFVPESDEGSSIVLPPPSRVVPAVAYRRDQEPFWLHLKDIADRLIAAAACAEGKALSWHPPDAPAGSGS
jgi:hypothetical protein